MVVAKFFSMRRQFLLEEMTLDSTHFGEKGHEVLAKGIMPELKKTLGTAFDTSSGVGILKNHHEVSEKYRNIS